MTPPKERAAGPSFDYEKSLSELSKCLAVMKGSTWSPAPKKKAALALAEKLIALADDLDGVQWCWLEDVFDATEPGQIDPRSGLAQPGADRSGFFKDSLWRLREMANIARREASDLPRCKNEAPALRFAAASFLHITYHCEKPFPPKLYDDGPAVMDFEKICINAGIRKSRGSLRNYLSAALDSFDPFFDPDQAMDFLVNSVS